MNYPSLSSHSPHPISELFPFSSLSNLVPLPSSLSLSHLYFALPPRMDERTDYVFAACRDYVDVFSEVVCWEGERRREGENGRET